MSQAIRGRITRARPAAARKGGETVNTKSEARTKTAVAVTETKGHPHSEGRHGGIRIGWGGGTVREKKHSLESFYRLGSGRTCPVPSIHIKREEIIVYFARKIKENLQET